MQKALKSKRHQGNRTLDKWAAVESTPTSSRSGLPERNSRNGNECTSLLGNSAEAEMNKKMKMDSSLEAEMETEMEKNKMKTQKGTAAK